MSDLEQQIDNILEEFAADMTEGLSTEIIGDYAHEAKTKLIDLMEDAELKGRISEVKKAKMHIPDDEYGHYLTPRLTTLNSQLDKEQK